MWEDLETLNDHAQTVLPSLVARALSAPASFDLSQVVIKGFASGGFNILYLLEGYPNAPSGVIVRIPIPSEYVPTVTSLRLQSEISTMIFVREKLNLPVPRIYGWGLGDDDSNPLKAPYLIMEKADGMTVGSVWWEWEGKDRRGLNETEKMKVLGNLAKLYGALTAHLPDFYTKIGSIVLKDMKRIEEQFDFKRLRKEGLNQFAEFEIGPLVPKLSKRDLDDFYTTVPPPVTEAFSLLEDSWSSHLNSEFHLCRTRWAESPDPTIHTSGARPYTISDFMNSYLNLSSLLTSTAKQLLSLPSDASQLTLRHEDFTFYNVLISPETLEVTSLLDFDGSAIVPLHLAARYPSDLRPAGGRWRHWTEDTVSLSSPVEAMSPVEKQMLPSMLSDIKDTWLSVYFQAQLARYDPRFGAWLWRNPTVELAVKLEQVIFGGWFT
ncbi:hypothetical protein BT69DRAFT_461589 [Atractiella rhizophila]|nr:hypothetical protein BT69DRAFT_461589 [Atractiella rhizophila]